MLEMVVLILLFLVAAANAWAYLRGAYRGMVLIAVVLKLVAVAGAAVLFWLIFRGEEVREDADRGKQEREIVVLEDRSLSMGLRGDSAGTSREQYRARAIRTTERLAGKAGVAVRRFCFGGNVLPLEQATRTDRERTRLAAAVEAISARVGQGAVLVLTDGCVPEQDMGGFGKAQAEERGVRFYSVACVGADETWREISLAGIEVRENNPERASVAVRLAGLPQGQGVAIRWRVDGADRGVSRLSRGGKAVCPLAELPPGWHEIEASVPAVQGEVCARNNTRRAVFRVTGERHVAFVHGRIDREQMEIARLLRARMGERLILIPEADAPHRRLPPETVSLVVVGRVSAQSIGLGLRECIDSELTRTLVLGSEFLGGWGQVVQLATVAGTADVVATPTPVRPRDGQRAFHPLNRLSLPVQRHYPGTLASGKVVLEMSGGGAPVLVADDPHQPSLAALLLDDTWRWRLNPDPAVRTGYETFWRLLLDWLLPEDHAALELRAELAPAPDSKVRLLVKASAALLPSLPKSMEVRIQGPGDASRRLTARYQEDVEAFVCETDYDSPGQVLWASAETRSEARLLQTGRVPIFREDAVAEYENPIPNLASLRDVASDPERGAGTASDCEAIVRGLLDSLPSAPQLSRRERQFRREALVALAIALALALEWLLERTVLRRAP